MKRVRVFLARLGRTPSNYFAICPPLGILYIAAYAREKFDLDIGVFDQRVEDCPPESVVARAVAFEPEVIGLSAFTSAAHLVAQVARELRQALPNALILLGGPHASASRSKALEDTGADVAVIGEGERAFEQVLEARLAGRDFRDIPGLIWRDSDGRIIANAGATPFIEDMDTLPFPAYDLVDIEKYWSAHGMALLPPRKYAALFTSRGCPYRCIFCHNIFGKRFRGQSPERVLSDIEHCVRTWGIEEFEILDDTFNHSRERVIELCDLILRRGLKIKITFPNGLRTDTLTQEVVDALADAGMCYSAFALEAGSPRIQRYVRKNLNIPRFLEGVEMAAKRRVLSHGFAMMGFPTETEEDLQQTIDVMCEAKLHVASFSTVTPYPSTELYERVLQTHPEKLADLDYKNSDHSGIRVNLSDVPDDVFYQYQRKAWRRFYLDPRRALRIMRDHRQPSRLLHFVPAYGHRLVKGLLRRRSEK